MTTSAGDRGADGDGCPWTWAARVRDDAGVIEVPQAFATRIVRFGLADARAWLDALPRVVEEYLDRWGLVLDGAPMHGGLGIVVPVRRDDEPCVLKVSWVDSTTEHEAAALRAWNGAGAVRLFAEDGTDTRHVLLLERLDSSRSLAELPIEAAVDTAGRLLRRLSIAAPDGTPTLRDWAERFGRTAYERADGLDVSGDRLDAAVDAAGYFGPSARRVLVHTDLHYENILAGEREPWLAIDPKVLAGDLEFAVGPLLWRRIRIAPGADPEDPESYAGTVHTEVIPGRLDRLAKAAGLAESRAFGWALVRCVDYELWGRSVGLTTDPARCAALAKALAVRIEDTT